MEIIADYVAIFVMLSIAVIAYLQIHSRSNQNKVDKLKNQTTNQGSKNNTDGSNDTTEELENKIETVKILTQESFLANKPSEKNSSSKDSSNLETSVLHPSATEKTGNGKENQVINVQIESKEIKAQNASEIVDVPKGVVVKVKRIRTIEHTINIEWTSSISGKGEIGFKQIVSASIEGEIRRLKGYASHHTESTEYEIILDGEKHNQYKLIWVDVWLKGLAEIQDNNNNYIQPFQFRDRTELKVVPYTGS
jgi:hypothetical protein